MVFHRETSVDVWWPTDRLWSQLFHLSGTRRNGFIWVECCWESCRRDWSLEVISCQSHRRCNSATPNHDMRNEVDWAFEACLMLSLRKVLLTSWAIYEFVSLRHLNVNKLDNLPAVSSNSTSSRFVTDRLYLYCQDVSLGGPDQLWYNRNPKRKHTVITTRKASDYCRVASQNLIVLQIC